MTRYLPIILLAIACEPETIRYCNWVCVDDNVEQTAGTCAEDLGLTRKNPDCEEPVKREAVLGEYVQVIGYDNDNGAAPIIVLSYVSELVGADFVLSEPMRPGLLGGSVWGADGALLGIVEGAQGDGIMWGRSVE